MERFWNIIYYFAYRADDKLTWYFYKYTGLLKLYNLPFYKKQFEKKGIKDPIACVMEANKCPDIGLGTYFALALVVGGKFSFILGLFMCFPNRNLPIELLIVCFAVAFLHDYIFLLHKNKWLQYFKEFDEKPREWKVKWAWISVFVLLFPFIFFLVSGLVLNPLIKGI